jgi:hypothetical protein
LADDVTRHPRSVPSLRMLGHIDTGEAEPIRGLLVGEGESIT